MLMAAKVSKSLLPTLGGPCFELSRALLAVSSGGLGVSPHLLLGLACSSLTLSPASGDPRHHGLHHGRALLPGSRSPMMCSVPRC